MHEISLRQNEGILPKWYNLWYTFTTNQTKGFRRSMPVIFLRYDSRYDASDNMKKKKIGAWTAERFSFREVPSPC